MAIYFLEFDSFRRSNQLYIDHFDTKEVPVRHPLLSLLDMLNLTYKRYQNGEAVSEDELRGMLGRKELPKWSMYLDQLVSNDFITETKNNEYILKPT